MGKNLRRVLVTGGTGTLGSALVEELANSGFDVVANYHGDESRARKLADRTGCQLARADVSDENAVEALFATKPFDAVIHLAGWSRDALLPRTSFDDWDAGLKINLQSAFLVTRASLKYLPPGGQLLLMSSRVGERGSIGQSAYGASKAAILGLMRVAALEGRASGLAVNALCPGFAPSEMSQSLSTEVLSRRQAENVLPNADAAQSLAALCLWLLQSRPNITGQILRPDCRIS